MAPYNPIRLTGLASGMDTDSIIENLMQIEKMKINREIRSKINMQWKQETYNSITSDISEFRKDYFTSIGENPMKNRNTYISFDVKLSGNNTDAVSVSTNYKAFASKITINSISQLASSASVASKRSVDQDGNHVGISKNGQLAEGNHAKLEDLEFATELNFDASGNISFSINDEEFTFNKSDSLQHMLSTVSNSNAGVTMNYSRLTDGFTIDAKEPGKDSVIEIVNISGNAFGAVNIDGEKVEGAFGINQSANAVDGEYKVGTNAIAQINGITVERQSNDFEIDGINYTLNAITDEPINASITQNNDKAVETISNFVDGYNTLVKKLNSMLSERKTSAERSYTPLTDEEKSLMSDKQVEEWEEIAKKGLMYNDGDLRGMLDSMRSSLYASIEGVGLSPSQIGLQTGNWQDRGQIVLDENMLRTALDEDADKVMRVFLNEPTSTDPAQAQKEKGLVHKLEDIMKNYTGNTQYRARTNLENSLRNINSKIADMEAKMMRKQEQYYRQFAAMEEAMAQLNNQTNSLISMLSQNNK